MTDIFKKAVHWYIKGNDYRRAALELYDEETLVKELENIKKENHDKLVKAREEELQKKLNKCIKLFPIGTLIDSDEGTDRCLNIVIGTPYIGEHDYHWPSYCNVPTWELGNHRTVLVKTVRISFNQVIGKSIVCLENLLAFIENPSKDYRVPARGIVKLEDYIERENKYKNDKLEELNKSIVALEKSLSEYKNDFNEYDSYKPEEFTQETIDEIVKKYKK